MPKQRKNEKATLVEQGELMEDVYSFGGFSPPGQSNSTQTTTEERCKRRKKSRKASIAMTEALIYKQDIEYIWPIEKDGLRWELDNSPIVTRTLLYCGEDLEGASLFIDKPLG